MFLFWFALPLLAALVPGLAGCTRDPSQREGFGTSGALAPVKPFDGEKTASNVVDDAAWARSKTDTGALLVLVLVLDDQNLKRVEVNAWIGAAFEEGVRLLPISDRQFLALGSKALLYGGLILPDEIRKLASDTIISTVRSDVSSGGQAMLINDFGAFALEGNQKLTYPIPKSRPSDLAGMDCVLQNLLDYARSKGSDQFKWCTMTRLADFMITRSAVQWTEQRSSTGVSMFELSHPSSLNALVWLLPKSRYPDKPLSPDGSVTVSERGGQWLVRPGNTRQTRFSARAV